MKCTQNTARGRNSGPNWVLDKVLVENDVYALAYLRIGSYAPGCSYEITCTSFKNEQFIAYIASSLAKCWLACSHLPWYMRESYQTLGLWRCAYSWTLRLFPAVFFFGCVWLVRQLDSPTLLHKTEERKKWNIFLSCFNHFVQYLFQCFLR